MKSNYLEKTYFPVFLSQLVFLASNS